MESDEESKIKNEENENSNFPLINIYNKLSVSSKDSSGNLITDDNKYMYICGKMFSHTSIAKYLFDACDLYLYFPNENKLYHSSMKSDECFTNSLKWNYKLFKNIRECLTKSEVDTRKYYYIINNSSVKENSSKEKDDLGIETNKTYLELHFFVKKRDIVAFRLLLEELIQNDMSSFFINQVMLLDNEYEDYLGKQKKKKFKQDNEIREIETYIKNMNDEYEKKTKEMLIKFNMLNKSKIEEENKLKLKIKDDKKKD